ncbi:hypothetical protein BDZ89DRAFT_1047778 [Hymenopellis radicata]|nr:hypothetical protein BDZ89DRAFT_1047778 [Hymenopellis radicata]
MATSGVIYNFFHYFNLPVDGGLHHWSPLCKRLTSTFPNWLVSSIGNSTGLAGWRGLRVRVGVGTGRTSGAAKSAQFGNFRVVGSNTRSLWICSGLLHVCLRDGALGRLHSGSSTLKLRQLDCAAMMRLDALAWVNYAPGQLHNGMVMGIMAGCAGELRRHAETRIQMQLGAALLSNDGNRSRCPFEFSFSPSLLSVVVPSPASVSLLTLIQIRVSLTTSTLVVDGLTLAHCLLQDINTFGLDLAGRVSRYRVAMLPALEHMTTSPGSDDHSHINARFNVDARTTKATVDKGICCDDALMLLTLHPASIVSSSGSASLRPVELIRFCKDLPAYLAEMKAKHLVRSDTCLDNSNSQGGLEVTGFVTSDLPALTCTVSSRNVGNQIYFVRSWSGSIWSMCWEGWDVDTLGTEAVPSV